MSNEGRRYLPFFHCEYLLIHFTGTLYSCSAVGKNRYFFPLAFILNLVCESPLPLDISDSKFGYSLPLPGVHS